MTNLNDTQLSHKVETPKDDKPIPAFYLRILTKKEKNRIPLIKLLPLIAQFIHPFIPRVSKHKYQFLP